MRAVKPTYEYKPNKSVNGCHPHRPSSAQILTGYVVYDQSKKLFIKLTDCILANWKIACEKLFWFFSGEHK